MPGHFAASFERIRDDAHAEQVIALVQAAQEWKINAEDEADLARRGELCAAGGLARLHRGEFSEAAALLRQGSMDLAAAERWEQAARVTMLLGHAYFQQGQAVLAARAYGEARSIAERHAVGFIRHRAQASRARALRRMGRLEESSLLYQALLSDPEARRDTDGLAVWRLNAASTAIRRRAPDEASELLDAVEATLDEHPARLEMDAWARTMRVWLEVARGERDQALKLARHARPAVALYGQYDVARSLERAEVVARGLPGCGPEDRERAEAYLRERMREEVSRGHLSRAVDLVDDLVDLAEAHQDLPMQVRLHKRRATLQAQAFESLMNEHERIGTLREEVMEARSTGEREHLRAELLKASNARLAELDRERRRLLLATAHDLRTPLGALQLTIDLSREDPPRAIPSLLDDLDSAVERMVNIVDQSLSEQAIFAGRMMGSVGPVELTDIVHRVCRGFDSIVRAKRLSLVVDVPELVIADVDPVGWSRIVQNLVSNAAKFSPTGGEITVRLQVIGEGTQVVLSVEDEGPGLPDDLVERGPRWGRRGDAHGTQGTGIGLAHVGEITDAFGGRLALLSAPGGGARVEVTLPLSS